MTTETMKKHTGVHYRAGSNVLQWRIKVPKDLRAVYPTDWAQRGSLGTSDLREANRKAAQLLAHWLTRFDEQRRTLNPQKVDRITPAMARVFADTLMRDCLAVDDDVRSNPMKWRMGGGMAARLDGMPEYLVDSLQEVNREQEKELATAIAKGQIGKAMPAMKDVAGKLGIVFDIETPGVTEALQECLITLKQAYLLRALRDSGEIIETPPASAPTTKPAEKVKPVLLRDVYDRWLVSGDSQRSADSIAAYGRALKQFEGQYPGAVLETISRDMGDQFRRWLMTISKTSKTARDKFTAIKSLLKYAAETLEWLPKQPWRSLEIKAATTKKRRPWTDGELSTLFTAPLHASYAIPKDRLGGKEAAYWILLLGLFTGTRLGELCQLRVVDVQTIEEIPVLVLTNEGENQSIKSEAGHRSVPIHSELIRLGFLGYVNAIKATGSDSLWPALPLRKGKPSDFFGRWFKDYRESLGMVGAGGASFHYFRHTVRPLMRRAGVSEGTQDKVTGHKTQGSIGTTVYDHWTLEEIQKRVSRILCKRGGWF